MTHERLADKTALITGAGSGIGREIGPALRREGARVVAVDLNENAGAETVRLIDQGGRQGDLRSRRRLQGDGRRGDGRGGREGVRQA